MPEIILSKSEKILLSNRGYKIFKLIGLGTDAKIYLANFEDTESNTRYYLACKVYNTKKMQKKYVAKFLPREVDILMNISHPYIIQVHSIITWKTKYYIFMRYAERGDLFNYIKFHGRLDEPRAKIWFRQVCLALKYLHDMDIAHRDLKCENILISRNYNVKLADFGFGRSTVDVDGEIVWCETYCGSLAYTAPEIIRGRPYSTKPTDLWSLGVILYVMLNRTLPFYETNLVKLYEIQMHQKWQFKRDIAKILSSPVKYLIINLLHPDSNARFQINDAIHSEWMMEDSTFIELTPQEVDAMVQSEESRNKFQRNEITQMIGPDDLRSKDSNDFFVIKGISEIKISDPTIPPTLQPQEPKRQPKKSRKCCIM